MSLFRRSCFTVLLLTLLAVFFCIAGPVTAIKDLEITIIDVGQGDSILIVTPEDKVILIDAGQDYRVFAVLKTLIEKNIEKIDVLISTHPDYDHSGGLEDVLEKFEVVSLFTSGFYTNDSSYNRFLVKAQELGIENTLARNGSSYVMGSINLTFLNPGYTLPSNDNDASVVTLITYGDFSALFTGDISSNRESHLVWLDSLSPVTVLKVSHHGSKDATSEAFLEKTNPMFALISVGEENKFGHPSRAVIERLESKGAQIFRTDIHGSITIRTNGTAVEISTAKQPVADAKSMPAVIPPIPKVDTSGYKYVASSTSSVFHSPSCVYVPRILEVNFLGFTSREEAIDSGRRPCKVCEP